MKKLFGTVLLALIIAVPISTMAQGSRVAVGVRIPLPPPIMFRGPPQLVVLPETDVYAVPDVDVDIFFYGGWWWRPMITGSVVGKDINGTNKEYPTSKFNKTGKVGKGTDIGRNKIIGVSKA